MRKQVIKLDGSAEEFDTNKILKSLVRANQELPVEKQYSIDMLIRVSNSIASHIKRERVLAEDIRALVVKYLELYTLNNLTNVYTENVAKTETERCEG